jgi:DNA-binding response OmpR family regulator
MKRILVIDDDPKRAMGLLRQGHFVAIAHTFDQIEFWLKNGPWDQICLDHDMGWIDGMKVLGRHGEDILSFDCPVRIWSHNHEGAAKMFKHLRILAEECDLPEEVSVMPFNDHRDDFYGPT